jgi:hypothetical protein
VTAPALDSELTSLYLATARFLGEHRHKLGSNRGTLVNRELTPLQILRDDECQWGNPILVPVDESGLSLSPSTGPQAIASVQHHVIEEHDGVLQAVVLDILNQSGELSAVEDGE